MLRGKLKGYLPVISITGIAIIMLTMAIWPGISGLVTAGTIGGSLGQSPELYSAGACLETEGYQLEEFVASGSPPESGAAAVPVAEINNAPGMNILSDVPAFDWSYGSAATSAAMLFGYYDRIGYSNMYTGQANGGQCPMDNAGWGVTVYDGVTSHECPLSASHQGVDGRESRGHVDDYWINYDNPGPDPYIDNGWVEHTPGDCTGDFMGTNQSSFQNRDGSTFFYFESDGSAAYDYTEFEPDRRDGCHGMRLFAESRGYDVVSNFSQYIQGYNGLSSGFTFTDFQAEIDAGRPVIIHVRGNDGAEHVMLGYGYNATGSIIYLRDPFNPSPEPMTWGGAYSGMSHYGVSVIHLADLTPPLVNTNNATGITADSATLNGNLASLGGYNTVDVSFEWGTESGSLDQETAPQAMTSAGAFTADPGLLTPDITYYFRAKASGATAAYGSELSFRYDTIEPAVSITEIDDFVKDLASVSGTAFDKSPGVLQKVQTVFMNTGNSEYWDGSGWVAAESWLDASGTTSWSYSLPDLEDGQAYQVKARSMDEAGNMSAEATSAFTFDINSPSVTVAGIDDFVKDLASVSGTASDTPPGVMQKVLIVFMNSGNSEYWDGSEWVAVETWLDASGTTSWSYSLPVLEDGQAYLVKTRSTDMAGNRSAEVTDTFICDSTNPSVTVAEIDDFVKDLASVSGTASDTPPGVLQQVQIVFMNTGNSEYWDGSEWVAAETWLDASGTTSWSYSLPVLEDGQSYLVKTRSTDMAGNRSAEVTDTFTFDAGSEQSNIAKWLLPVFIAGGIIATIGVLLFRYLKSER